MNARANAPVLERGDRIPNFVLPNHDGRGLMYYDMATGGPGIILVDTGAPFARAEVAAIAEEVPRIDAAGVEVVIINRQPPEENAELASVLENRFPVLTDPGGSVSGAIGTAAFPGGGAPERFAIVHNANQRILSILPAGREPLIGPALDRIETERPVLPGESVAEQAPVLLIPSLLDADECAALIAYWGEGHDEGGVSSYRDGKAFGALDYGKKKRRDRKIDDIALRNRTLQMIGKRLSAEIYKAFAYQDFILEPPIIGCYDADRGDYFGRHRDNLSPQTASRRFALSLNLNDGYEGGGLVFPEYGGQEYRPAAGAGIVFSCAHVHEALPVTEGERFVFLTFLHDPERQPHPWSMPEQRPRES